MVMQGWPLYDVAPLAVRLDCVLGGCAHRRGEVCADCWHHSHSKHCYPKILPCGCSFYVCTGDSMGCTYRCDACGFLCIISTVVLLLQLQLMRLAFVIVTMVLLFAEYLRIVRLPTVGLGIHSFMAKYIGRWLQVSVVNCGGNLVPTCVSGAQMPVTQVLSQSLTYT